MRIMLDPGHGGVDSGAVGPTGLREKDVNLAVAKKLANYLQPVAEVKMTRDCDRQLGSDENTDLRARVGIAESWQADYFISIHCNGGGSSAKGIETFAYQPGGKGEQLAKAIQTELVKATGLVDRGVKFANYYVLRKTSMPAVLLEMAFISNPAEEKLLKDPAWQDRAARAIATGVAKHLGKELPAQPPALRLRVNGEFRNVPIRSVPPGVSEIQIAGTWIPVREIVTALGGSVRWNQIEKVVEVNFY